MMIAMNGIGGRSRLRAFSLYWSRFFAPSFDIIW